MVISKLSTEDVTGTKIFLQEFCFSSSQTVSHIQVHSWIKSWSCLLYVSILYKMFCYKRYSSQSQAIWSQISLVDTILGRKVRWVNISFSTSYRPVGGETICLHPADGSSTRGGSTSVRGFAVQVVPTLLCSSWQDFYWHSASRGPSAVAELLLWFYRYRNFGCAFIVAVYA